MMWRIYLVFFGLAEAFAAGQVEQLQPRLLSLAEALRQDLTGDENAARKKLEEKANEMREEDENAAGLLRKLAQQGRGDGKQGAQVFSHSSSASSFSESQVSTDGQGRSYVSRHVKTCKNGVCQERTETSGPKGDMQDKAPMKVVEFTSGDALDQEIHNLRKQMRSMESHMKLPEPESIFAPVSEDFWKHFRSMSDLSGHAESASHSESHSESHSGSHSESVSEETVMRDGHAVRRVKRCKNGKCKTTVEHSNPKETPRTSVLDLELP
eukprot:Skav231520  [mRNA]  locus=scaffold84:631744:637807:- [translate_table: standard]